MLRSGCVGCDKRKIDICAHHSGKLNLSLFSRFLKSLERHFIISEVYSVALKEGFCHVIHYLFIEVVSAESVISGCCQNFDNAVGDVKKRYVKRSAAEVKYEYLLSVFLINAVCKRCRGRLVDNSLYVKACNLSGVLCCLSLCIREVCRNGNNRFCNGCTEVALSVRLKLLENHCRYLLRRIALAVDVNLSVGTHISLY